MPRKGKSRPKGRVPKDQRKPKQVDLAEDEVYEFTLQSGRIITYKPINPDLRQAIFDQWPDLEVPMLEVKTVDGGTELIPDPENMDYLEQQNEVVKERSQALIRLLVVQSLAHMEPDEGWDEQMGWIMPGWKPPEDPLERKLYWVEHWLLGPKDLPLLLNAAQLAAAVTPEEVEQQLRNFRVEMARTIGEAVGPTILASLAQLRTGDDTGSEVGGDTVVDIPGDG